jgi:uncharacterized protein YaaN involved in tellurite resistance
MYKMLNIVIDGRLSQILMPSSRPVSGILSTYKELGSKIDDW